MTIDPITGIDTTALESELDQIPLSSNPVPLVDWNAQGRQGQVYYPDNIPPVFAVVSGQDPNNTDAGQSIQTDGNHAAKVYVVNQLPVPLPISGGGGGGGFPSVALIDPYEHYGDWIFQDDDPSGGWSHPFLYGFNMTIALADDGTNGPYQFFGVRIIGLNSNKGIWLWKGHFPGFPGSSGCAPVNVTTMLPFKIDLAATCDDDTFTYITDWVGAARYASFSISLLVADS